MHGPAEQASEVSEVVAQCAVCHAQWQVRSVDTAALGCAFCDAPPAAIRFRSEAPDSDGVVL